MDNPGIDAKAATLFEDDGGLDDDEIDEAATSETPENPGRQAPSPSPSPSPVPEATVDAVEVTEADADADADRVDFGNIDPAGKLKSVPQFDDNVPRDRLRNRTAARVRTAKSSAAARAVPRALSVDRTPPSPLGPRTGNKANHPKDNDGDGDDAGQSFAGVVYDKLDPSKMQGKGPSVPDQIYNLLCTKVSIPVLLLLACLYLWCYAPVQPVSESYAKLITHGCSFDPNTKILCTSEGCFRSPYLDRTGPTTQGSFDKRPEFVTLRHTTGWLSESFSTLKSEKSVRCVVKLLGVPTLE